MTAENRLRELMDIDIRPELFHSLEARIMDPQIVRKPHEFFQSVRERSGDVVEVADSKIDGVLFPTLLPMNPDHPNFLLLGLDTVMQVTRDQGQFHQNYGSNMDMLMGEGQIAGLNPPNHKPLRALIMQAFDRKSVDSLEEEAIAPLVSGFLDRIAEKEKSDLVADLTCRLPTLVICEIFNLPTTEIGRFAKLATDLMNMSVNWEVAMEASAELGTLFRALIEERRTNPGEDLLSHMLSAEIDGERLTETEMISFCRALVPAGIETTTRALSTALTAMLGTEGYWNQIRGNPSLIPQAVEEILRWNGPVMMIPKKAAIDTQLAGASLPKDANLWVCTGHANRDPQVWSDANVLDIHRKRLPHVMFSAGSHFCLGNQLARRELVRCLRVMSERFPDMRLNPEGHSPDIVGIQFRSVDQVDVITGK